MPILDKPNYEKLDWGYKLSARSVRVVFESVMNSVRWFAEGRRVKFRGRKLGMEAYVNAAAWHMAEQPREEQERILRTYLGRIESYLVIHGGESDRVAPDRR